MTNVTLTTEQAQQIEEAVCNAITALREALDHISASGKPIDGQAKKAIFFSKCPKCKYAVSSMDAGAVWWCPSCKTEWPFGYEVPVKPKHDGHWSDCSVHNEPAYPNGECDCDGYPPKSWKCACGANLYIDSNGAPAATVSQLKNTRL